MKHVLLPFGLLLFCTLMACAKQIPANQYLTDFPHNKEAWAAWRASATNISQEAFRQADQGWDATTKPPNYGADYQHKEGQALWHMHCAACHGPHGRTNPQKFTPAPRKFGGMGLKMGFFFGGDKMRAGIFEKIKTGQSAKSKAPSQMAGFGDLLHNEQIWALVLHLENL